MADDHVGLPKKKKRSVISRSGDSHKTNCEGWKNSKSPFPCNAHHILVVSSFNPIDCKPKSKAAYCRRCVWVSEWDINGGNRFKFPKGENNMVRLPLFSAYYNAYPSKKGGLYNKRKKYPVNECMHNSRYSEHYLYNKEVRKWLNDNVWSTLQENKEKHKFKGKPILGQLQDGESHFRGELITRGSRKGAKCGKGTKKCWENKKTDKSWFLPFSMASDGDTRIES